MNHRKERILVIDDELDMQIILKKIFGTEGYEVSTLPSASGALEKIRDWMPDLILLDIMLPGVDGKQLKAQLNADKELKETPVIFLSARSMQEEKLEGLNLHADDYVTKPFDIAELLARVRLSLDRHRYYQEISMTDGLTGLPRSEEHTSELQSQR